jgi:hypothetical protein
MIGHANMRYASSGITEVELGGTKGDGPVVSN